MEQSIGNVTVRAELNESDPDTVSSLNDVATKFDHLRDEMKEHLYAVFLNSANKELAEKLICLGTARETSADIADIVRTAALTNAQAVIVVHNHPSGDPSPSSEDITVTERLQEALNLLDIMLLDHVIVGRNGTHSMKQSSEIAFDG